jgi:hypothetical protein
MSADHDREKPLEWRDFEVELGALAPTADKINRDELMYRAGWEAHASTQALPKPAEHSGWLNSARWKLSTAALLLLAATLATVLVIRAPEVHLVYIKSPPNPMVETKTQQTTIAPQIATEDSQVVMHSISPDSPSPGRVLLPTGRDYLSLRGRVLAFGADVLPLPSAEPLPPENAATVDSRYGTLIGQLLGG